MKRLLKIARDSYALTVTTRDWLRQVETFRD